MFVCFDRYRKNNANLLFGIEDEERFRQRSTGCTEIIPWIYDFNPRRGHLQKKLKLHKEPFKNKEIVKIYHPRRWSKEQRKNIVCWFPTVLFITHLCPEGLTNSLCCDCCCWCCTFLLDILFFLYVKYCILVVFFDLWYLL